MLACWSAGKYGMLAIFVTCVPSLEHAYVQVHLCQTYYVSVI